MRFLRLILISFVLLFALASLIGILLPSQVLVSRAVNISAPTDTIARYINDINQWKLWVEGMDKDAVRIHNAHSARLGNTNVTITTATDSSMIAYWQPGKGIPQTATMRLIRAASQPVTIVQWQFEQKLRWYPWERLGSMMNDKILGKMMEDNLNHLKRVAEGQ